MSAVPPSTPGPISSVPPPTGLAITALALGLAALLIGPLGVIAIVLGIVALRRERGRTGSSGKLLAIFGIVLGVLGIIASTLLALVVYGAMQQARQIDRMVRSQAALNRVGMALASYHSTYQSVPESEAVLAQRLSLVGLAPGMLTSPSASGGQPSYFYLPVDPVKCADPAGTITVYENPDLGQLAVTVLFVDGHVEALHPDDVKRRVAAQKAAAGAPAKP